MKLRFVAVPSLLILIIFWPSRCVSKILNGEISLEPYTKQLKHFLARSPIKFTAQCTPLDTSAAQLLVQSFAQLTFVYTVHCTGLLLRDGAPYCHGS
jgi:hypothetical protein